MANEVFGFIGLGNMGQPMARHVRELGCPMVVHDIAGAADRAPEGAEIAESNGEVTRRSSIIALSLPTVEANRIVVNEIVQANHAGSLVVDTCTIGPRAAIENAGLLAAVGIDYLDSPVSGLKFRAEEGALASMAAGSKDALDRARPMIEAYSRALYHVGPDVGQGQRMKIVNNALYISSLVTVSEALAYGEHGGLDLDTMLDVINASSGQNFATSKVFPKYIATDADGDTGGEAHIIKKDLRLFVDGAIADRAPNAAIAKAYEIIEAFAERDPLQDQARIYSFIRDKLE
jgi:3-hydroxyisobutyrate dehydrogenase